MICVRPIRCFTCGKVLGDKFAEFEERVSKGEDPKKVLDEMGIERYCCRTVMITSVDTIREIAKFKRV